MEGLRVRLYFGTFGASQRDDVGEASAGYLAA